MTTNPTLDLDQLKKKLLDILCWSPNFDSSKDSRTTNELKVDELATLYIDWHNTQTLLNRSVTMPQGCSPVEISFKI